jgi:hypothetical protein
LGAVEEVFSGVLLRLSGSMPSVEVEEGLAAELLAIIESITMAAAADGCAAHAVMEIHRLAAVPLSLKVPLRICWMVAAGSTA